MNYVQILVRNICPLYNVRYDSNIRPEYPDLPVCRLVHVMSLSRNIQSVVFMLTLKQSRMFMFRQLFIFILF